MTTDPTLTTLLLAGIAAAMAALGALPYAFGASPPRAWVAGAYALPSGVMIGAAYLLGTEGLREALPSSALGALIGVAFIYWTQRFAVSTEKGAAADPVDGYRQLLQGSLHSASEGVAIGVAMAVSLAFGTFLALVLAVHNVGEALGLTEFLSHRGMKVGECAGLAVATKLSQPLLAVATLAILTSVPQLLAAVLGFAASAMFSLVLGELVPTAYRFGARRLIALLLSGSAAAVLFFEDLLL